MVDDGMRLSRSEVLSEEEEPALISLLRVHCFLRSPPLLVNQVIDFW